jgi:glucose-fructose oxidoreductase
MAWTMEFTNGFVCDCLTSYANPRPRNDFRAEGPKGWIKINKAYSYRDIEENTSRGRLAYHRHPPIRRQMLQMDDFARCIIEDRTSTVSGEMGLRDMKIIAAIYGAAEIGSVSISARRSHFFGFPAGRDT